MPRSPGRSLAGLLAAASLGGRGAAQFESVVYGCPLRPPPGMWPPAAAFEGADARARNVVPAAAGDSPARATLRLHGLCSPDSFRSSAFRFASGRGAWTADLVERPRVQLAMGLERCELQGLAVAREASPDGRLTLRLQFGRCNASAAPDLGSSGSRSAAVEVDLHESRACGSNLLPWMCRLQPQAAPGACLVPNLLHARPETTGPPGEVSLSLRARWREVGGGRCMGAGLEEEPLAEPSAGGPAHRSDCRNACVESLAKFQLSGGAAARDRCRGFAFSPKAFGHRCILYRSPSVDVSGSEGLGADSSLGGWSCWAFDVVGGSFSHRAPGEDGSRAGKLPAEASDERLSLFAATPVAGGEVPAAAVLRRLEPPERTPGCYHAVDWYTLESSPGVRASVCVREGDIARIRDLVPPKPAGCCTRAPGRLTVDRVCVAACGADGGGCFSQDKALSFQAKRLVADDCPDCWPSCLWAGLGGAAIGAALTGCLVASCYGGWFWRKQDHNKRFRLVMTEYDAYGQGQLVKDLGEGQVYSWDYQVPVQSS